jgi:hypothetical protein
LIYSINAQKAIGVAAAIPKPMFEKAMKFLDLYLTIAIAKNAKAVKNSKGKPNLKIFSITVGSYPPELACLL